MEGVECHFPSDYGNYKIFWWERRKKDERIEDTYIKHAE